MQLLLTLKEPMVKVRLDYFLRMLLLHSLFRSGDLGYLSQVKDTGKGSLRFQVLAWWVQGRSFAY